VKSCLSYQSSIDSRQQSSASFHAIFKPLYSKVLSHSSSVDSSSMIPIAGDFRSFIQVGRRKGARVIKNSLASCLPTYCRPSVKPSNQNRSTRFATNGNLRSACAAWQETAR
jgi:hypothetical protein